MENANSKYCLCVNGNQACALSSTESVQVRHSSILRQNQQDEPLAHTILRNATLVDSQTSPLPDLKHFSVQHLLKTNGRLKLAFFESFWGMLRLNYRLAQIIDNLGEPGNTFRFWTLHQPNSTYARGS